MKSLNDSDYIKLVRTVFLIHFVLSWYRELLAIRTQMW